MKMKKLYFLIIFLLLFSNISFSNKNKSNNWQLVWNDEFNDDKLDKTKWAYWENDNPWNSGNYLDENGNLVDQYGFNAKHYYLNENTKIENGNLVITIKKENNKFVMIDGKERKILYSSGAVHTRHLFSVEYGKIEMRAAMPKGIGLWPAFWMWPLDHNQARDVWADGEIDIVEVYGDDFRKVNGTVHVLLEPGKYQSFDEHNLIIKKNENLSNFNTYALEWDKKELKWLFNGRVYKKVSMKNIEKYAKNPFEKPYYLMINVALKNITGNDGDVDFPTELKVDYVRVYKKIKK
jgi:glucan endo-1,3-beta-D-glucosidase